MIQANELRVGNYYLTAGSHYTKATAQTISDLENGYLVCNPIPITEEILLNSAEQNGFAFIKTDWFISINIQILEPLEEIDGCPPDYEGHIIKIKKKQNEPFVRINGVPLFHINSVHLFQNLMADLIGKELEINFTDVQTTK